MNELTQTKIRIGDVTAALGIKRNALRNWFDRNQITLLSDQPENGWSDFTLGDVAVLAIMRRLVRWGVPVDDANEIALSDIVRLAAPLFQYRNTPAAALIAAMNGRVLALYYQPQETEPQAGIFSRDELDIRQAWAEAEAENVAAPHSMQDILMIDVRSVLLDAFQKLGKI